MLQLSEVYRWLILLPELHNTFVARRRQSGKALFGQQRISTAEEGPNPYTDEFHSSSRYIEC